MAVSALDAFHAATRKWFVESFTAPTAVQEQSWPHIRAGRHTLLAAPTGSGKTLAAFLAGLDSLLHRTEPADTRAPGYRLLYVSPLKALANDIERNLHQPLAGIVAASAGTLEPLRIDLRTGDTAPSLRQKQARNPGDILITTPESLYLLLGSRARDNLRTLEHVIIDEIHAVADQKRGVHLALSLERLDALCGRDIQRIGLSATQNPITEVARFLGGDRAVEIVDASAAPHIALDIAAPISELLQGSVAREDGKSGWSLAYPRLLEQIRTHRCSLIFCNSRRLAERLAHEINELAGEEIMSAHHGSLAPDQRRLIEDKLKSGALKALAATGSMELGVDMSHIDLVVQIESPGSVARGLQRVGRAGHSVGAVSTGTLWPKFRGDLLESAVVAQGMVAGAIEPISTPQNCLDVLAQHIVAMCAEETWTLDALERLLHRCHAYRELGHHSLLEVIDMLSGRYPSDEFAELRPRILWDRRTDELTGRRGSKMLSLASGGTIPDRGLFPVVLGANGTRIGELDEEMVFEARPGETFYLGASTWRIEEIARDRVIVSPAPGLPGKMPFWRGEGPGRPFSLGRKLGELTRALVSATPDSVGAMLGDSDRLRLDDGAALQLLSYVHEQREATGEVPSDRVLVAERYRDEVGDWRVCLLSPFGARVHAPWALALGSALRTAGHAPLQSHYTDDGIALHLADREGQEPDLDALFRLDPKQVGELVRTELSQSALFASHFRENAARALLLPRRDPRRRAPLWAQRLRAQNLLHVARQFPSFPMVLETFRECLQDVFDVPALVQLLTDLQSDRMQLHCVTTRGPSPFARSLVFSYVASYLYEGDAPSAERRAQALSIDHHLLSELLGQQANFRELLEPEAMEELERQEQRIDPDWQVRDADELHDHLRRCGDYSLDELQARCVVDASQLARELVASGRAQLVAIGDGQRLVAEQDVARYHTALVADDDGAATSALADLLVRYLKSRAPRTAPALAEHFGVPLERALTALQLLEREDRLQHGDFTPGRNEPEWCHPTVLDKIRRRSLERLRAQIAPVDDASYTRFLLEHHGITSAQRRSLLDVLPELEACPLPFAELESRILPARVADFRPSMLDELGARGELVWWGIEALGRSDLRMALARRSQLELFGPVADDEHPCSELALELERELAGRGASFLAGVTSESFQKASASEQLEALQELVHAGRITNDTFGFLRALGSKARGDKARARSLHQQTSGRWSTLSIAHRSTTERMHAAALVLLRRYGIVSRLAAEHEGLSFAPLLRVLTAMETAGRVRRGHFVQGLGGAQFALPGVVDRLRLAARQIRPSVVTLAACDPANAYGATLPWPGKPGNRGAGSTVVLVDGHLALFLDRGSHALAIYDTGESLVRAVHQGLAQLADRKTLRIRDIDREPARSSRHAELLRSAGFHNEAHALVLERYR